MLGYRSLRQRSLHLRSVPHHGDRHRQSGQTLVEFALVVPIFLSILIGIVEFAFAFNALLATNFASRDAALVAAEAGSDMGADCVILQTVETDLGAPADRTHIAQVDVYRATAAGAQIGNATIYVRTGAFDCPMPDGTTVSLPYTRTQDGYPATGRCNVLNGCGGMQATVDVVAVKVAYRHTWRTPFGLTFGPFLDVIRSNSMRMEPVL